MATTRENRQKAIDELEKRFSEANGIFLTDFHGINVENLSSLRRELHSAGATYVVVKNSLSRIALEKSGRKELSSHIRGPVGMVLAKGEAVVPAKIIKEFKKRNKDVLAVKGAYVDGAIYDERQTLLFADLPPRDVLLSQLLSCLQAPMTNFAGSLKAILTKCAATLEAVRQKKEAQG